MRPGVPNPGGSRAARQPTQQQAAAAVAMSGAVDLAAIKARNEAAERAANAPAPTAGSSVVDVSEASFQADVLDRSFQVPVLIDLWAEWCQPCKQLSPILEKLAAEGGGSWVLAKVDADANPAIAQALQVQGIPAVFAVIKGQLIPGFQGALPEAQVREFVAAVVQAGQENGLDGAVPAADGAEPGDGEAPAVPEDPRFSAAEEALEAGDYDLAEQCYRDILAVEPANELAGFALGQVALLRRIDALDNDLADRASGEPDNVDAQLAAADRQFAGNEIEAALRTLLDALARLAGEDREPVRKRLIEYFDLLGPDDPNVGPARREMARALF